MRTRPKELRQSIAWDPLQMFKASKAIDGYPEENTFILTAQRVDAFYGRRARGLFYEFTASFDDLLRVVQLNARLIDLGIPRSAWQFPSVGIPFYRSGFDAEKGRLPLPGPCETEVGGHCVALLSWTEDGNLVFPNSWGPDWGDNGWGYLSREYVERLLREAWVQWDVRYGLTPAKADRLLAAGSAHDDSEWKRIWIEESRPFLKWGRHRGARVRFRVFETVSLTGRMVEILEIRDRLGVLIAWAHVHYGQSEPKVLDVTEFYVWPAFRRRGFGTLLSELVLERAQDWGANAIAGQIYQADALPAFQSSLAAFLESAGFGWKWDLCRRALFVARVRRELR